MSHHTKEVMQIKVEQQGSARVERTPDNPSEIPKSISLCSIRSDPRCSRGSITAALLLPVAGTICCLEIAPCLFLGAASPFCFPFPDFQGKLQINISAFVGTWKQTLNCPTHQNSVQSSSRDLLKCPQGHWELPNSSSRDFLLSWE